MPSTSHSSSPSYFPSAFFSAFTTLPGFQDSSAFFNDDIKGIFDTYREGLKAMQRRANGSPPKLSAHADFLYRPVPYMLFGEFDLAVFSMIDDLTYATQHFKPPAHSKQGFKYQINTGIVPLIQAYKAGDKRLSHFQRSSLPDFFSKKPRTLYPFTGIVSIKLNNAMLVGTGRDFLKLINFFLVTHLDREIESRAPSGIKMFYILNENLGWNELAIYFFGNSIEVMNQMVMDFRQLTIRKIHNNLRRLLRNEQYNHQAIKKDILPIIKRLKTSSLLSDLIEKSGNNKTKIKESHPFIATASTFGFRPELIKLHGNDKRLKAQCKFTGIELSRFKEECSRDGFISIGWKTKPGHECEAAALAKEYFPSFVGEIFDSTQSGKYPFIFPAKPISLDEYLAFSRRDLKIDNARKSLHIVKIKSNLHWSLPFPKHTFGIDKHYVYDFRKCKIAEDEIKAIQRNLFIYPIPYTFKNQIESLINNFNDAIDDPLMYSYFIGLKFSLFSFLQDKFDRNLFDMDGHLPRLPKRDDVKIKQEEDILKLFEKAEDDDSITISSLDTDSITEFIQNWNKAYWNRYFHSYYFTEINDFNIEHHGGIQQILFSYDTIYRLICKRIYGDFSKHPFVNVQVGPTINSTQFYNTINFTHLFRPAIYACECVHEAANHIIPFMVKERNCLQYRFIFDPNANRMGADTWSTQLDLEARLQAHVGPRDNYERAYLHVHFGLNSIRHLVTDFATYLLGYSNPSESNLNRLWKQHNISSIRKFYHSHWFLFLLRTDLYYRENLGKGNWFFKGNDFQALFMRFNLMFYLFMEMNRSQLDKLNQNCPSIELHAIWESEKKRMLDLVERLGHAIRLEFAYQEKQYSGIKFRDPQKAIAKFRDDIISQVFNNGWKEMNNKKDRDDYRAAIQYNQKIIFAFYNLFTENRLRHNMIIRESFIRPGSKIRPNITFHDANSARNIFLDPKGNIFITAPNKRKEVLKYNIQYLKNIWDLSLKVSLRDYPND